MTECPICESEIVVRKVNDIVFANGAVEREDYMQCVHCKQNLGGNTKMIKKPLPVKEEM